VRGLVRLLDLPAPVQDKVSSGEITQGAARKLLTIARVDPKQVTAAVEHFASGTSAEDVIMLSMSQSDNAFSMWGSWNDGKPRAGSGLWPLDMAPEKFPMAQLPELRASEVAKALDMEFTADLRSKIERYLISQDMHPVYIANKLDATAEIERCPEDADLIERIVHLANPPACASCPFHAVADRTHYCGFKPCHGRKRKAWVADEMQKISKRLKIAVYDPVADGKAFIPLEENTYQNSYKVHAELVKKQDPGLRLQAHKSEYSNHKWTESRFCRLILVGKTAEAVKKKKRDAGANEQAREEERRRQYQLEQARRDGAQKFAREYASPLFAVAFKEMTHVVAMCALAGVGMPKKNIKKADVLADLRRRLADKALRNLDGLSWSLFEKGPLAVAKYLQKVATTWGVKLPGDFMDVAKGFEPAVAVETTKGTK
jgi:hypothetical protein